MSFSQRFRPAGFVLLAFGLAATSVASGLMTSSSDASDVAARVSVSPQIQYRGDSDGTTFTFTITNPSATKRIGAVEIHRPDDSWTITSCPSAPQGWSTDLSKKECRYVSDNSTTDDIGPGATSSAFEVKATTRAGDDNADGTWRVKVSRTNEIDSKHELSAAAATSGGLKIIAYSFEVLDVVVDPVTTKPGADCPASSKSADVASGPHTFVVCGRNRTNKKLTPSSSRSDLGGSFVARRGRFTSGSIAASSTSSRILGSWTGVTITASGGTDKTVLAKIGSSSDRTSPVTTLTDYQATTPNAHDPVAVDDGATVAQGASATAIAVLGNDTDADGGPKTISSASDPAHGTVVLTGGTAGARTGLTYEPDPGYCNDPAGLADTFTYTLNGGSVGTVSMTVTCAANADPVIAGIENAPLAYTENDPAKVITSTATVSDADSANFGSGVMTVAWPVTGFADDRLEIRDQGTGVGEIGVSGANVTFGGTTIGTFTGGSGTTSLVVTFNANATPEAAQALLRNITYRSVSERLGTFDRTLRFLLSDGDGGAADPAIREIAITGVNDDPTIASIEGAALAYTEGDPETLITATGAVTDVDETDFDTGTLTADFSAGGQPEDRLEIRNQGTGPGQIGVSGSNVTYAGSTIGTFTGGTGTAPLVITFDTGAASIETQAVLRNITYRDVAGAPVTTGRTVRFVLTDGDGGTSAPATRDITIGAVDHAPVVTIDLLSPTTYAEQAGFQNLFGPATTLTDSDSATLSSVKVTVSAGFDATNDTVRLNPLVTGFTTDFTGDVLTLTRVGGTLAEYENALRNVQFSNTSDDPDHRNDGAPNPSDADRTVSVTADDGTAGGVSTPKTQSFSITPVNDAPFAPASLPAVSGIRNTTLVTSGVSATEPHVTRAAQLIGPSLDPDGPEANIKVVPVTDAATSQGGRITLTADGDLRYEPPASSSLSIDTYGYALTDGTSTSTPITFTVGLSGGVWYVADGASGPQDGTAARPFATVAAAVAVSGQAEPIYISKGSGDGVLPGSATLNGETLIGAGVPLTNEDVFTSIVETIVPAAARPVLTASDADVLTLTGGTVIRGLSINPDGASNGVTGVLSGTSVVFDSSDVTDTGTPATQTGFDLTGSGGLDFRGPVSFSTTQAGALNLSGISVNGDIDSVTVTGSTNSPGISLTNTGGSPTFTTTSITTTNQPGFVLNNAASVDVAAGSVAVTNRAAVDATGLAAGTHLAFTDVDSTNSTGDGVNLDGTHSAWTFSAGAGSTITGAAGIAFDVNNGTGAVSYAGSVGAGAAGKAIDVSSRGANTTFSGNITSGGTSGGISVTDNTAGTTTFSGATKTLSTGPAAAVNLTNNTAAPVAFSGGGLALTSTSGAGFKATGGGTVTVTGTGNTISTTTGTGLNVTDTTIGSANMTFQSISSNGASSGIVLADTGSAGTFSVTGTPAVGSGGTIQNTTGPGISLTNADAISLNRMQLLGTDRSGVQGVGVTGFSFTNGSITNAGDSQVDDNDSSIAFNTTTGGHNHNVDGAVTITGNALSNAYGGGVDIFQYAGMISNAVITGNTISSTTSPSTSRRSGIAMNLFGSTTTVASLTKGNIANNTVTGFPSGDGISIQGANTASSTAPAGSYGTPGSATDIVTITGNEVIGDATNKLNGFGIAASVTGRGQGNFSITNNGTITSPLRYMKSSAIAIGAAGDVTTDFVVTDNEIDAHNGFGSSTLALGIDKNIQADLTTLSTPVVRATITGNSVANSDGAGIRVLNRDSNGTVNLRVDNNTVADTVGAGSSGITVANGSSGNASFNPTMCASISNNNAVSGLADGFGDKSPGISISKRSSSSSTYAFGLTGLAPSPATTAQTESHVTGLNPNSAVGAGFYAGKKVSVDDGDNFTSCTLPAGM